MALDLAGVVGFAVGRPSDRGPLLYSFQLPGAAGEYGVTYVAFEQLLEQQIDLHEPALIVFEAPLPIGQPGQIKTNVHAVRRQGGLAAVCELVGYRRGIRTYEAGLSSVRAHFIQNGRPGRDGKRLVMRMCDTLGWRYPDHNAADAAAVWSYTVACMDNRYAHQSLPLFR